MEERKKEQADDDVDNQLIDKLVELLEGEIPEAMYRNKANDDLRDFSYRLQSQGMDLQTYMKYTGQNMDAMREGFMPQAERQVKLRLALEKIAELEQLKASDDEVEEEYKKLAENYHMEPERVKALVAAEDLAKDVAVEKAITFVRDNAVVTDAPAEEPEAKEAEKAE